MAHLNESILGQKYLFMNLKIFTFIYSVFK